ncbi:MAG: hypothetical protein M0R80_13355 [Proteobacteria bacterium]|nr:hypothetical protein [Pseudomonadota bacterium]
MFTEDEDKSQAVFVEGVITNFKFHPGRLSNHREDIISMLNDLPEDFQKDKGGGWSFLNACVDRLGRQWGEHINIEQLLVLGIAIKYAKILLPRDMWNILPGGMPYFSVGDELAKAEIAIEEVSN